METPCSILPFGQRAHDLRVVTDECRVDACHFQEFPDKLEEKAEHSWRALPDGSLTDTVLVEEEHLQPTPDATGVYPKLSNGW